MQKLQHILDQIRPLDSDSLVMEQERLDRLTKPPGSLGRLEELAAWYVQVTGKFPSRPPKKVLFTFAADHGVAEEGVSAYPKAVTAQMVYNFLRGGAAINVLARHAGIEVRVVDIGVDHEFDALPGLIRRKVACGTQNLATGPAMTREQALTAMQVGIELAEDSAREGADIIGTGDMGIANTTSSSAITATMTGRPAAEVTGRGTGIGDPILKHKQTVIEQAIRINRPDPKDPVDVLTKVGGFEIAGIAGLILGAAAHRIPVVVDGFISTAAALIAAGLQPMVKEYLLLAHYSAEPGHRAAVARLGLQPLLDLGMRLGEGTGAALAIGLVEASLKMITEMATFEEAGVSDTDTASRMA
ncbi:MAG: nicotinate-nucleotide--dimethylbenzimidazole phosphoribosyltransferase [Nitrospirae bacterium]|nr:nicotinate-nucleotide--dimethylbenzimidazole phosphoribosyltransferase [Nitrospirota bacterium]